MAYDYIPNTDYSVGYNPAGIMSRYRAGAKQGEIDRDVLAGLPYQMLGKYNEIAKYGVLGQGGAQRIGAEAFRSGAYRRALLTQAVRKRMQSRLGSRSLAADNAVLNRVVAPELASANQNVARLMEQNESSKMQGLQGIGDLMQFIQQRYMGQQQLDAQREASSGGFLDWALPLISVATGGYADIFGGKKG